MKRPTKRKMYQKRRKREKAEQRKKDTQGKSLESGTTASKFKNNHNKNNTRNHRSPEKFFCTNRSQRPYTSIYPQSPITSYSQSLQLWWHNYCSAIQFHCHQQNACSNNGQEEELLLLEQFANEYETSSEDDDDDNDVRDVVTMLENSNSDFDKTIIEESVGKDVDEEYLKFLEITYKHREELRLKREQENSN